MIELVVIKAYYDSVPNVKKPEERSTILSRGMEGTKIKIKLLEVETTMFEIKKFMHSSEKPIATVVFNGEKLNDLSLPLETTSETR